MQGLHLKHVMIYLVHDCLIDNCKLINLRSNVICLLINIAHYETNSIEFYEFSRSQQVGLLSYWLSPKNFFPGQAKLIVLQSSFVMLVFLLFWTKILGVGKQVQGAYPWPYVEESQS